MSGIECMMKFMEITNSNQEELDVHSFIEPIYETKKIRATMSNNKQSMKLYTEEQVRQVFVKAQTLDCNGCILYDFFDEIFDDGDITPIQLPSDEEIRKWAEMQSLGEPTGAEEFGRIYGAKFVIDKIQGGNK